MEDLTKFIKKFPKTGLKGKYPFMSDIYFSDVGITVRGNFFMENIDLEIYGRKFSAHCSFMQKEDQNAILKTFFDRDKEKPNWGKPKDNADWSKLFTFIILSR